MTLPKQGTIEWEQLCDNCGRCCLKKFIDDKGNVRHTRVACFMLDIETHKCTNYLNRRKYKPSCFTLTHTNLPDWMPETCAYMRVKNGKPLASKEEIQKRYPWDKVISERTLRFYNLEDYPLCSRK